MTVTELRIEVISERTGDSKNLVAEVVNLMRRLMTDLGAPCDFMDERITPKNIAKIRKNLMKDDDLIDWYKQGLHYYNLLSQKGDMQ